MGPGPYSLSGTLESEPGAEHRAPQHSKHAGDRQAAVQHQRLLLPLPKGPCGQASPPLKKQLPAPWLPGWPPPGAVSSARFAADLQLSCKL